MILSILKKISLNLEKCFETVTTRLLFSKLLLILLFSHKILIFFKKSGGPTLLLDPQFYSGGPWTPGSPGSGPHAVVHSLIYLNFRVIQYESYYILVRTGATKVEVVVLTVDAVLISIDVARVISAVEAEVGLKSFAKLVLVGPIICLTSLELSTTSKAIFELLV